MIFGLAFIPIMMAAGVAIDYRHAATFRSRLQASVDSAAVMAASSPSATTGAARMQIARDHVEAALGDAAKRYNVSVDHIEPVPGRFRVTASAVVPTSVMKIARFDSIPVTVSATAATGHVGGGLGGGCVLSLNESAVNGLSYDGRSEVRLRNCNIFGNSASAQALEVSGDSRLLAHRISVHGHVKGVSQIIAEQGILEGEPRTPDPYLSVPLPAYPANQCTRNNF